MLTLTTGTAFIMWVGEQITERGIGNGISLIIFAGIVDGIPGGVFQYFETNKGNIQPLNLAAVTAITLAWISSTLCAPGWPGMVASGRLGMPRPSAVATACPRKPSHTSDEVGTPALSHASLARSTAGVQEPQQAMQLIAASTPSSLKRCGRLSSSSFSFTAWVLPNSRQLTHLMSG